MLTRPLQSSDAYGYDHPADHPTRDSAGKIVPLLVDMLRPKSVVDVGCGVGIWLSVFRKSGVEDVCGVDGTWVPLENLTIPKQLFVLGELNCPRQTVAELGRKFDLALCLEVAEHLSPKSADELVDALVSLADLVCFSAAIPQQGGFQHINEQWQSYWATKFNAHGYRAFDVVRPRIGGDKSIQPYYRQNIVVYGNAAGVGRLSNEAHQALTRPCNPDALDFVLPEYYLSRIGPKNFTLGVTLKALPGITWRSIRTRLSSLGRKIQIIFRPADLSE